VQSHIWILLPFAVEKALSSTHLVLLRPEVIGPDGALDAAKPAVVSPACTAFSVVSDG
jgi:hypothetical protein